MRVVSSNTVTVTVIEYNTNPSQKNQRNLQTKNNKRLPSPQPQTGGTKPLIAFAVGSGSFCSRKCFSAILAAGKLYNLQFAMRIPCTATANCNNHPGPDVLSSKPCKKPTKTCKRKTITVPSPQTANRWYKPLTAFAVGSGSFCSRKCFSAIWPQEIIQLQFAMPILAQPQQL